MVTVATHRYLGTPWGRRETLRMDLISRTPIKEVRASLQDCTEVDLGVLPRAEELPGTPEAPDTDAIRGMSHPSVCFCFFFFSFSSFLLCD